MNSRVARPRGGLIAVNRFSDMVITAPSPELVAVIAVELTHIFSPSEDGMIIALAGRRIDAPGSQHVRFPLLNRGMVERKLRELFERQNASAVVSSAAAGADLLALSVAGALGVQRRIVLPFDPARFRETSVIDRPGDWGTVYDQVLNEVKGDDLITLENSADADSGYSETNRRILEEALNMANPTGEDVCAVAVWDGRSRGEGDLTEQFVRAARDRGLSVIEVLTV